MVMLVSIFVSIINRADPTIYEGQALEVKTFSRSFWRLLGTGHYLSPGGGGGRRILGGIT